MSSVSKGVQSRVNPFPPAAMANYGARGGVSIPTRASKDALAVVSDYLSAPADEAARGRCVAIVGEFGTGKTHLALEMLHELDVRSGGNCTLLYVDAPGDSFLNLYRDRFLSQIDRADLRHRVSQYYADIVADEIGDSELTSMTAAAVRSGQVAPDVVVSRFGLASTKLANRLSERLREVTRQPEFASALTLFLRPEYEASVWQWLRAGSPDAALMERGVTKTIDSDVDALEAMGVITLLYGQRGNRLALVLDELEKILVPLVETGAGEDVLLGLKRLIEISSRTGTLLILCGLPDYFELLSEDTRQRISLVIRPATLTSDDTRNFIAASQGGVGRRIDIAPFTLEAIGDITSISRGNPRKIIRLCYLLYRASTERNVPVSRALVREIAREQFESVSMQDVAAELERVFDRQGWQFERNKQIAKGKGGRVDYWIASDTSGAGCALLLSPSILDDGDARTIVDRAERLSTIAGDTAMRLFLVVNGGISNSAETLIGALPIRVFESNDDRFLDAVTSALAGAFAAIERNAQSLSLTQVLDRIDQLGRQVGNLGRDFAAISEGLASKNLEDAAESGMRRLLLTGIGPSSGESLRGFPHIATIIDRASRDIEDLLGIVGSQTATLPRSASDAAAIVLRRLSRVITRFSEDVGEYLAGIEGSRRFHSNAQRDSIERICSTADQQIEDIIERDWRVVEMAVFESGNDPSGRNGTLLDNTRRQCSSLVHDTFSLVMDLAF